MKQTIADKSLKHDWAGKKEVGQMRIILTDSGTNEKTPIKLRYGLNNIFISRYIRNNCLIFGVYGSIT